MIDRVTDFTLAGIGILIVALTAGAVLSPRSSIQPDDPRVLAYLESVGRTAGLELPALAEAVPAASDREG